MGRQRCTRFYSDTTDGHTPSRERCSIHQPWLMPSMYQAQIKAVEIEHKIDMVVFVVGARPTTTQRIIVSPTPS
eukprot:721746-Amphidinium_carterae.1